MLPIFPETSTDSVCSITVFDRTNYYAYFMRRSFQGNEEEPLVFAWFCLICLFNTIWCFVGYSIQKPFLLKRCSDTIQLKAGNAYIYTPQQKDVTQGQFSGGV